MVAQQLRLAIAEADMKVSVANEESNRLRRATMDLVLYYDFILLLLFEKYI